MRLKSRWLAQAALPLLATGLSACTSLVSWENAPPKREPEQRSWNVEPPPPRVPDPLPQRPYGPGEHLVKQGDTLYSIAFRNQVDFRDLARWNNVGPDYLIYPGQVLRLSATLPITPRNGQIASQGIDMNDIDSRPQALSTRPTPVIAGVQVPLAPTSTPGAAGVPLPAAGLPPGAVPGKVAPPASPTTVATTPIIPTPDGGGGINGWRWPVDGTVVRGYNMDAGSRGLDFTGDVGQPVVAAAAGKVVYSGSALKGYGELVIVKHDDLRLSAYGYNRRRLVKEGDVVAAGQQIAELGVGPENKPLLHFEIRERGKPVNPVPYLPARVAVR